MIVYCCPKCKMVDLGEENEQKNCMKCGSSMFSLGIQSSEWNKLSNDQMKEVVKSSAGMEDSGIDESGKIEEIEVEKNVNSTSNSVDSNPIAEKPILKQAVRTKGIVEETSDFPDKSFYNEERYSRLSIAALICSLFGCTSIVGIILGTIDLVQGSRTGDRRKKALSIAAIALGAAIIILGFAFTVGSSANRYIQMQKTTETIVEYENED